MDSVGLRHPGLRSQDGAALWHRIATGEPVAIPETAVERFCDLAGPALADALLGPGLLDLERVARGRLNNRFRLAAGRACLAAIAEAGIEAVAIKGFALAHTLYDDPAVRAVGDLDVLVRPRDRDRLIAHLSALDYTFVPLPRPPWGFISEASYAPFASPDGACNLDIHVHPDCYPAYRSLTTERVFAGVRTVECDGFAFLAPCDDHAFALCATNVAKDKFGIFAARKIADAMLLARGDTLDWDGLDALAREGRFAVPYRVFVRLLSDLGVPRAHLPAIARLPAHVEREYARMLDETLRLYPSEPGTLATLRRELLLSTEPAVGLRNAWSRLKGFVRRGDGVPRVAHR